MTTTDTDALTERIRRARSVPAEWARLREGESTREQIERHQRRMDEQTASLIAAEVRKAKAEALREAAGDIVWSAEALPHMTPHDAARGLVRRADRIETGDSDEHR